MNARRPPFVVAIAGFDPSCGAGVVADARSIAAMGAMPLAVVTAITFQSGHGVRGYAAVPAARVLAQFDELADALELGAVKIGQLPNVAIVRAMARRLARIKGPIVLDPVLVASGGGSLAAPGVPAAILASLVPISALVTVNLSEAGVLCGRRVTSIDHMKKAAAELEACGAAAVLVKGGHLRGDPVDVLRSGGRELLLRSRRIGGSAHRTGEAGSTHRTGFAGSTHRTGFAGSTHRTGFAGSMHGTGCALASAIAARLACGDDLEAAVRCARDHVRGLLRGAVKTGRSRLRAPS